MVVSGIFGIAACVGGVIVIVKALAGSEPPLENRRLGTVSGLGVILVGIGFALRGFGWGDSPWSFAGIAAGSVCIFGAQAVTKKQQKAKEKEKAPSN